MVGEILSKNKAVKSSTRIFNSLSTTKIAAPVCSQEENRCDTSLVRTFYDCTRLSGFILPF